MLEDELLAVISFFLSGTGPILLWLLVLRRRRSGRYYRWAQWYYRSPGVSVADPVNTKEMG
jgi:hypothetical protein